MVLKSVFPRPGPVPIQTPPPVPSTDPTTLPLTPQTSHKATAASQFWGKECAKARGGEDRLRRELVPILDTWEDLHVDLLQVRRRRVLPQSAEVLYPVTPWPFFLRGRREAWVRVSLHLELGGQLSSGTMWGYECLMTSYDNGLSVC